MFLLRRRNETLTGFLEYQEEDDEELRSRAQDYYRRLRRRERNRNPGRKENTPPTTPNPAEKMNNAVQEMEKGEKVHRYTGFKEPFHHDRNTTLPHPDADTSQNATIYAPDFNLVRTNSRRSGTSTSSTSRHHTLRHPLGGRNSSKLTKEELAGMYDNIVYADGTKEGGGKIEEEPVQATRQRKPTDSGIDMGNDGYKDGSDSGSEAGEKKRKGLFRKLGLKN